MDRYGYVISREGLSSGGKPRRYAKQDLELMTTHQLREICRTERIISGVTDPLDKDDLIRVILRYRGADEHLLITRHSAEGMEALQRMVSRVHLHLQTDVRLTCNASIAVYRGCAVGYYDRLTIPYDARLAGTNVLVVSGGQICGILNLVAKGTDTDLLYLTKSTELPCRESPVRDYSLYCMDRAHSAILYRIYNGDYGYLPEHLNVYRIPLLDFSVREPVELNIPLAIDFGTSSTTAGVYLDDLYFERIGMQPGQLGLLANQPNYAVFYDVTQDFRETPLLPSVVGVRSVGNGQPRFLFGYEAVRFAGSSYIDEGFCVFYDIKRWVRDPEKSEEIADREGRRASIPRKQILRAYFEYLIREVCSRFKCRVSRIHLSSPAKQKHLFQQLFSDLLPNYAVEQDGMLDEGMSVLYNTISGMIVQGKTREGAEYRALVLDCGGGTTDLCSCRFRVSNRRVSYRIDLQAAYENGDTDFGGNNLTYRGASRRTVGGASRGVRPRRVPVCGCQRRGTALSGAGCGVPCGGAGGPDPLPGVRDPQSGGLLQGEKQLLPALRCRRTDQKGVLQPPDSTGSALLQTGGEGIRHLSPGGQMETDRPHRERASDGPGVPGDRVQHPLDQPAAQGGYLRDCPPVS